MINKINDEVTKKMISNMILLNPLDKTVNSFSSKVLKNRQFYMFNTNDWRYFYDRNNFDISKQYIKTNFSKSDSIFDNSAWDYKSV